MSKYFMKNNEKKSESPPITKNASRLLAPTTTTAV